MAETETDIQRPHIGENADAPIGADAYRVDIDVFTGPLDLLLYLIRRDELDIQDVTITLVADQYLAHVRMLEALDPNVAGEFLVLAATLVELKSRALLPTPPIEALDDDDDPRVVLVRQLLEYKRFKDAAKALSEAAEEHTRRFVRRPADLPDDLRGVELEEVEVWDLLTAFQRVMESIGSRPRSHQVRLDDTPIAAYMERVLGRLEAGGPSRFEALFTPLADRAEMVGTFLAILELIREQRIRAEQEVVFGEIYLFMLDEADWEAADESASEPVTVSPEDIPVMRPTDRTNGVAHDSGSAAFDDAGAINALSADDEDFE
ncbi:MAG: segregation/condensation protein A [Phycisphaerales bacterium]|nr:segregation/condensation protein A [Phycisphaerales bacterium]